MRCRVKPMIISIVLMIAIVYFFPEIVQIEDLLSVNEKYPRVSEITNTANRNGILSGNAVQIKGTYTSTVLQKTHTTITTERPDEQSRNTVSRPSERIQFFNASIEPQRHKDSISSNKCVRFKTPGADSKICIYDTKIDIWVSGDIARTGLWEGDILAMTERIFSQHPTMQLLDIGCNIGVFTIYMAKLGKHVVSLDANKQNLMMLSKSLMLNNLQTNVTILWNAVSDVYENVSLTFTANNIGGAFVKHSAGTKPGADEIISIKIDDLTHMFMDKPVFIKMDIESYEWKALNGSWKFFESTDVRYVLMEYNFHKLKNSGQSIRRFMTHFGFKPYTVSDHNTSLEMENDKDWPGNVLWNKE